jgi:hypothetical protein
VVEVQPIIHKEVEQPIVHHVEQHIVEPAAPNVGGVIRNAPIIDEHVQTRVVEGKSIIVPSFIAYSRMFQKCNLLYTERWQFHEWKRWKSTLHNV